MKQSALFLVCYTACCCAETITYHVKENSSACTEVRMPGWTRPANSDRFATIDTHECSYELRSTATAGVLAIGLSCGEGSGRWRMKERYSVPLGNRNGIVRQIGREEWDRAAVLEPSTSSISTGQLLPAGLQYAGSLYPKSGRNWVDLAPSAPDGTRVTVTSYSGVVEHSDLRCLPCFSHYHGKYWTEIYAVASSPPFMSITGTFHGADPAEFQRMSHWMGSRYFLQPLETQGMRRLLICDVDSAARLAGFPVAPRPMRTQSHDPQNNVQARISGLRDRPVFLPDTQQIERVEIVASLEAEVAGKYRVELDVEGIRAVAEEDLKAGHAELVVPLPAAELRKLGSAGPYRIRSAWLSRLLADGPLVRRDLPDFETRDYSPSALGAPIYFTGRNSAQLIRGKSGTESDRLQVRIGFETQAQYCQGAGYLDKADPKTNNLVFRPVGGEKELVLEFTGAGIAEAPIYWINGVTIHCGADFSEAREIPVRLAKHL